MLEIWLSGVHVLGTAAAYGQAAEAEGIDGISFSDTQNITADPFAGLCLAAAHTNRLGLMGGCDQSAHPCSRRHRRRDRHSPL